MRISRNSWRFFYRTQTSIPKLENKIRRRQQAAALHDLVLFVIRLETLVLCYQLVPILRQLNFLGDK